MTNKAGLKAIETIRRFAHEEAAKRGLMRNEEYDGSTDLVDWREILNLIESLPSSNHVESSEIQTLYRFRRLVDCANGGPTSGPIIGASGGAWEQAKDNDWLAVILELFPVLDIAQGRLERADKNSRGGRPKKGETGQSTKVIEALILHHQYKDGGIGNYEPARNCDLGLTKNALTRFLEKMFPDETDRHAHYRQLCVSKEIKAYLKMWNREPLSSGPRTRLFEEEQDRDE